MGMFFLQLHIDPNLYPLKKAQYMSPKIHQTPC
jgi:hypothetical protein